MTDLEAIRIIKKLVGISPSERIVKAVGIAEYAIEKQFPKKIIKHKDGNFFRFYCPNCSEENTNPNAHYKHCQNCGQSLDWWEGKK